MKIIKLDAINSTNSFLKDLVANSAVDNFTVIVTQNQTNGRGQQEGYWISEPFKNLTFSVFINDLNLKLKDQKYLNFAVSLAIYQVLYDHKIKRLSIKWPNDILAVNKKVCGVLIENNIRKNKINSAIIGIGLNVNQISFPKILTKVTSMQIESNQYFDLDHLLNSLLQNLKQNMILLREKKYRVLEDHYLSKLYRKNQISTFKKGSNHELFNGIIVGISEIGNLQIQLEDNSIKEFGIKEVSFA